MEQPTPTTACADWTSIDKDGLRLAVEQARKSYEEGGIPIGAVILIPMYDAHPNANLDPSADVIPIPNLIPIPGLLMSQMHTSVIIRY